MCVIYSQYNVTQHFSGPKIKLNIMEYNTSNVVIQTGIVHGPEVAGVVRKPQCDIWQILLMWQKEISVGQILNLVEHHTNSCFISYKINHGTW